MQVSFVHVVSYHSSSLVPSYIWSGNEATPAFQTCLQPDFCKTFLFFFMDSELQVAPSIVWGAIIKQILTVLYFEWHRMCSCIQCMHQLAWSLYGQLQMPWKLRCKLKSVCFSLCVRVCLWQPVVVWWIPWLLARLWPDNFLRFVIVIFNSIVLLYILMWVLLL